ncbi:hypothetical protein, partial [Actinacidiphila sp. bgisy160]|uniref:hypothetical protein n=1 Tax=Actinacidiphila sp. bgisy160 TaxID=3413796 RepID=UPI003D73E212
MLSSGWGARFLGAGFLPAAMGGCSVFGSLSWSGRGALPRTSKARSRTRRVRLGMGAAIMAALVVGLLPAQAMAAPPPGGDRSGVDLIDIPPEEKATDADTGVLDDLTGEATVPPVEYEPVNTTAPAGGQGEVTLTDPVAGGLVQAGSLPVLLGAPEDADTPEELDPLKGTWQVEVAT